MSKIIGIFGGTHNASVSYIEDGKIKFCLEEEKVKGIKSIFDFGAKPFLSLEKLDEAYGVNFTNVDYIAWCESVPNIWRSELVNGFSGLSIRSDKKIEDIETVYSHHKCHAAGAYYTSNYSEDDKVLVVTLDGGGRTSYGRAYIGHKNKLKQIRNIQIQTEGSIGQLWMQVTEYMGWKMLKDEGKVMGLAGHGVEDPEILQMFRQCVDFNSLTDSFTNPDTAMTAVFFLNHMKKKGWFEDEEKRKDIAATLQSHTEEIVYQYIRSLIDDIGRETMKSTNIKKLAVAGGIFANVKLNQRLIEALNLEELYVYPPMGDDGLSLGAAILKSVELGEYKIKRFRNVFLGTEYPDYVPEKSYDVKDYNARYIAEQIHLGRIVAVFRGKLEYGPRALGNRSILVRATDEHMHEKLNKRLGRHEIMPFAPIVLDGYQEEIFDNYNSEYTSEFMTICYTTKTKWRYRIPAVIHEVDNTARPQVVKSENNPQLWSILKEYDDVSGIPVLLNTSFNGHGEPIVENPDRAFKYLDDGVIDMLVFEDTIYTKK